MPGATSRCWSRRRCATPSCSCAASTPIPSSSPATTRRCPSRNSRLRRSALAPVLAVLLGAGGIEREGVVLELEAPGLGHGLLPLFDLGVEELLHPAAIEAHQV